MAFINNKRVIQVVVANSSEAKMFQTRDLGQPLDLIQQYFHPESRVKGIDLVSDRPGRYKARMGLGRGAYAETYPKEVEADRFARELAGCLNEIGDQHFDDLVVIAPPHFNGLLNKHYSRNVRSKIKHVIEKDYTKTPERHLQNILQDLKRIKFAA